MKSLYEEYYYNLINRELNGEIKNFNEEMLVRIKNIPNLKRYTVVAVVDELYVNEL